MDLPTSSMRDLAQRLLAAEAVNRSEGAHAHGAVRVCEKLRISLSRIAGAEGFTSLLRRALVLARAEAPALSNINVKPDGSLEGLESLAADTSCDETAAGLAITAHLLGLLVTFIGQPLTIRLLREAWPHASLDD